MRLVPESSPFPRLLVFPLGAIAIMALFLFRANPDIMCRAFRCPLLDATGFPCPTCGGTTSVAAVSRGDLTAAFVAQPFAMVVGVVLAIWGLSAMAATFRPAWRQELALGPVEKKAARWAAFVLIILSWAYQIWRVRAGS